MNKFITAVLFVTLTGNFVYAAEPIELTDVLKAAFEAKLLQENGVKKSEKQEIKSPVCACEQDKTSEIPATLPEAKKDNDIHQ